MPRGIPNVKSEKPVEVAAPAAAEVSDVEPEVVGSVEVAEDEVAEPSGRWESFEAVRPNGDVVVIKRNIDTGDQSVTDK